MFTGIVTAIGTIREARQAGDLHAVIACPFDPAGIAIGASIACSGTCLTVVEQRRDGWRCLVCRRYLGRNRSLHGAGSLAAWARCSTSNRR